MDIDRVRYFCAFASTGSLVKASALLRISQPALSKALRLLEHEVGAKLVEPEGRGLRLTDQGRRLQEVAQPLLARWSEVPKALQGEAAVGTGFRLGAFEVFSTYFLGHWLKGAPVVQVEAHELIPGQIEEAVAKDWIDAGVTYAPVPRPGVEFVEATRVRMGVFGARRFVGTASDRLPFAIPIQALQGTPSRLMGLDGWPEHRHPRQVACKVTMMESALELCRQGLAVAYLPEFVVRLHNETVRRERALVELACPLPKAERLQSVYLVLREGRAEDANMRSLAKALRAMR